ncbi:MAG: hypothetical protein KCHDKBKB_01004 [Elusimicrobia bacterium]|nr:hypothetical protein [Elusimicrobiota bacterium]
MIPIHNGRIRVLVVEDNDDTAKFELLSLTKVGFEVQRVSDGGVAIQEMKQFLPNIVILDLELPGRTGDQIQEDMFKDPLLKDIPVIVSSVHLTDSSDPENLGNKYQWIHHRFQNHTSERLVKKLSQGSTIKDLLIEVTIACGDIYKVIPVALHEYWKRSDPKNVPPFQVI